MRRMMRGILAGAVGIFCMTAAGRAAAQERLGPGVPLTLAEERARRITDLRYDLLEVLPRRDPFAPNNEGDAAERDAN